MADLDSLEAELRALGRTLVVEPPAEDLTEQVLAALPATVGDGHPGRGCWRGGGGSSR